MLPSTAPTENTDDSSSSDRILILGAGYGGLRVAQLLTKQLDGGDRPEIALIDRHPYHQVITELPIAASGRYTQADVEIPLQKLVEDGQVRLIQAEVTSLDLADHRVLTATGPLAYGTLVIALGSVTAFYGVPGLQEHALTLKSVDDAAAIRERVDQAIATAAGQTDPATRQAWLTTIIGGAGLTGVELAGELADFIPKAAKEHGVDPAETKIVLVDGGTSILAGLPQSAQVKATETLQDLNVEIRTGTRITAADADGATIGAAGRISGRTLIWTGGIVAPSLLAQSGLLTAKNGQVLVDPYLRANGHPEVYAIGDSAYVLEEGQSRPVPPTAQTALEHAETVAYNIFADRMGYAERPFRSHDKGLVVSVGTQEGVASLLHIPLTGRGVLVLKDLVEERYRFEAAGLRGLFHRHA